MLKPKVLIPQNLARNPILFSPIEDVLDPIAEIIEYDPSDMKSLKLSLPTAVGAIGREFAYEDMLSIAPKLKVVACYGVGYDNCDVDAMTRHEVYLTHTPGVLTDSVADHAMALLLAVNRTIVYSDNYVRTSWAAGKGEYPPLRFDLRGKTLGIIGFGRIGSALVPRAKGFGMNVSYYDEMYTSYMKEMEEKYGAKRKSLEELLRESDFISIHVNLTPKTQGLIGEKELHMMKKTAYLINTSRGPVVDQKALGKALAEGAIAGAGLDVFEVEPIPLDDPLLKLKNVVLTPHQASATLEARVAMARCDAENIAAVIKGEVPPPNVVPEQAGMIFNK